MSEPAFDLHGPADAPAPLVLDSPHSGRALPPDFGAACTAEALRDGEDVDVDALWLPATALGVPLLAARWARTYLDLNRHAGDLDPALLDGPWPADAPPLRPSGKAAIGKALLWRTLDDGRPIYDRRLTAAETLGRIGRVHRPYHAELRALLDAAHARHGTVWHFNCHSMNAVGGTMGEGGAGRARADIVLGDRDGTTCAGEVTAFVAAHFAARGYAVAVNDPFKGVELVRAFGDPARGRHSLQIELNKRLYLSGGTHARSAGFARLQADLLALAQAVVARLSAPSSGAGAGAGAGAEAVTGGAAAAGMGGAAARQA